jgi:hypothetical protein
MAWVVLRPNPHEQLVFAHGGDGARYRSVRDASGWSSVRASMSSSSGRQTRTLWWSRSALSRSKQYYDTSNYVDRIWDHTRTIPFRSCMWNKKKRPTIPFLVFSKSRSGILITPTKPKSHRNYGIHCFVSTLPSPRVKTFLHALLHDRI